MAVTRVVEDDVARDEATLTTGETSILSVWLDVLITFAGTDIEDVAFTGGLFDGVGA